MAIKRAKNAFGYMVGDPPTPRVVNPGMLFEDSDPVVSRFPDQFEDVETHVSDQRARKREAVEAATAEPGERRSVQLPKRPTRRKRGQQPPTPLVADEGEDAPLTPEERQQAIDLGLIESDDTR